MILKRMTFGELFLLSLTSKKSMNSISYVVWREIKKIEYSESDGLVVYGVLRDENRKENEYETFLHIYDKRQIQENPRKNCHFSRCFTVPIGGVIGSGCAEKCHPPILFIKESLEEPIVEMIYNRIDRLFGKYAECKLSTWTFFPKFIRSTQIDIYSRFSMKETKQGERLDDFISSVPIQKRLALTKGCYISFLNPNSKFYFSDELIIHESLEWGFRALSNFKGRKAFLYMVDGELNDFFRFLNEWKSKRNHENLKILEIHWFRKIFTDNEIDCEKIKQDSDVKKIPSFIDPPVIEEREFFYNGTSRFRKRKFLHYIVRDDGIVAWIFATKAKISFCVQSFTENQMLEKDGMENSRSLYKNIL
uniref:F-box domain-containing protein n=1 Tax=Caenorhabditis tropicalis TaxID=1561998 RepID=A0A1I7T7R1_9PELO